jgi:hypothetical protein
MSSFLNKNSRSQPNFWSHDLLAAKGIELYHRTKEVVASYNSLNSIENKREVQNEIVHVLTEFTEYQYSNEEIEFINSILKENTNLLESISYKSSDLVNILRSANQTGVDLLNISAEIDIPQLKQLYRKAAIVHHPDKGGSDEKMQLVNHAYTQFLELIELNTIYQQTNNESSQVIKSPLTFDDYVFIVHFNLLMIFCDSFAADKAYQYLMITRNLLQSNKSSFIGQYIGTLMGFGGDLFKISKLFARFQMREELIEASQIVSKFLDRYVLDWSPHDEFDERPKRDFFPIEEKMQNEFGLSIIIKHINQAENSFRLGKISEKRYQALLKKYDLKKDTRKGIAEDINKFIINFGFVTKLSNSNYEVRPANSNIIMAPYLIDRFDFLEENQKAEYLEVFGCANQGHLFEKYYEVRVSEILLGLIQNFDHLPLENIKSEIDFFQNNFDTKFKKYQLLNDLLSHLNDISSSNRNAKLALLNDLDIPEQQEFHGSRIVISYDNLFSRNGDSEYKKRIVLNDDYIHFASMDFQAIQEYRENGILESDYTKSWNKDLSKLEEFHQSEIAKNRDKIWFSSNPSPEDVIKTSEKYLTEILILGKTFHPKNTGELQLGYEVNRITTAYAKLKDWKNAIYWAELIFELPINYRDRLSDTEASTIKKRLARCREKLTKA